MGTRLMVTVLLNLFRTFAFMIDIRLHFIKGDFNNCI